MTWHKIYRTPTKVGAHIREACTFFNFEMAESPGIFVHSNDICFSYAYARERGAAEKNSRPQFKF
jgi:hypothetical protein